MLTYPPLREPVVDPTTGGRATRPWALFFQQLLAGLVDLTTGVTGTLGLSSLPPQAAGTLLGRGTPTAGVPEVITLGTGLTMTGTVLSSSAALGDAYYEPLTDGDLEEAELVYALGDVVMVEVYL